MAPRMKSDCSAGGASSINHLKSGCISNAYCRMAVEIDVTTLDTTFSNDSIVFLRNPTGIVEFSSATKTKLPRISKCASDYRHTGYGSSLVKIREPQPDEYNASRVRNIEKCRCLIVCAIRALSRVGAEALRIVSNTICSNVGICGASGRLRVSLGSGDERYG